MIQEVLFTSGLGDDDICDRCKKPIMNGDLVEQVISGRVASEECYSETTTPATQNVIAVTKYSIRHTTDCGEVKSN